MNLYHTIRTSFTLALLITITGCGTAELHESWDSETRFNEFETIITSPEASETMAACAAFETNWDATAIEFEARVLELTNQHRAEGANCRTAGVFPAVDPLTLNKKLECAARLHSTDMAERAFFNHLSPEGTSPSVRVASTGYPFRAVGENIAAGQPTPEHVVESWMHSDGHCANIMRENYRELGVAYVTSDQDHYPVYWTQVFGTQLRF